MNDSKHKFGKTRLRGGCNRPTVGERLSAYIAGLLEGSAAKEVEDHLLECISCREFFLTVSSMRGAAREINAPREGAEEGAKVLRLADFKKGWP